MDVYDRHIPEEEFATCLRNVPQATIDLVVELEGGVLLARRANEPARGEWFWPGGRVYKGESLEAAVRRIAAEELGIEVEIVQRLGVSEHFFDASSISGVEERHTIPVIYRVRPSDAAQTVRLDDQHTEYRILRTSEPDLHCYVQQYLDRFGLVQ